MNIVVMLLVLTVAWVLVCPPGGCAMQEFPGDPQDRGVEAPVALQDCDVRTAWKEAFHRKEARNDSGTILRSPVTGVIHATGCGGGLGRDPPVHRFAFALSARAGPGG